MPIAKETQNAPSLVTSREPEGVKTPGAPGSDGMTAFRDAVIIIGTCWAIVFALTFSLRKFNV